MSPMETTRLTDDLWRLRFRVGQAYALRTGDGCVLIDTGLPGHEQDILAALDHLHAGPPRAIVLTHCHDDHCGSAAALAAATGAPILAGAGDAPFLRGTATVPPPVLADRERPLHARVTPAVPPAPRPVPVDRELSDGDTLDWGQPAHVLHIPGHTPGSIAVHLPRSGVLFTGDAVAATEDGRVILGVFNTDPPRAADAMRRLATLDADIACFGHGPAVVGGAGPVLRQAAARL